MSTYIQRGALLLLFAGILLTACSGEEEALKEEIEQIDASDDELIAVIETNIAKLMDKDLEGYMDTIHPDSPVFETTEETIQDLFAYDIHIELVEIEVVEKSAEEAILTYTQRSIDDGKDSTFENNETVGEHILRPDDDGWKIYQSEVMSVEALEQEEDEPAEVAEIEGEYSEVITNLETPFPEDDWYLISYEEGEGEARAEYIPVDENAGNYEEMVAYDYYENGNEISSLENFVSVFQLNLEETVTGDLEFNRFLATESEVFYQFSLRDDATEANQDEIGRIFLREDDLFVVSYTLMEEELDEEAREEIIELLGEI
jgi:hypothetical protein